MEIPLTALAFCGLFALVSGALLPYCARRLAWLAAALALAGTPAQAQSVQLDELKATREGGALVVTAPRLPLAAVALASADTLTVPPLMRLPPV